MHLHTEAQVAALLRDHSTAESWMNRQLGAQLVAQYNYPSLSQELLHLLSDRNEWVRYHALGAALRIGLPRASLIKALGPLLRDPFFRVRQKASEALLLLDRIGDDVEDDYSVG